MNKKLLMSGVVACFLGLLSFAVYSGEDEHHHDHDHKEHHHEHTNDDAHEKDEIENHGTHEHGVAKLSLATTEIGFDVILDTPAVNVFGFEHVASTDEQKQQLEASAGKLRTADVLFVANAEAACSLQTVELESPLLTDKADVQGHVDLEGSWSFSCDQPDKLAEVKLSLFEQFPESFERLDVEWVTEGGASAKTITQDDVIKLK